MGPIWGHSSIGQKLHVNDQERSHDAVQNSERVSLRRAVFFKRLGELRDRTHENQRLRASGLNFVVAAIVLWNTVYLERAVAAIRQNGQVVSDEALAHFSPLKWEHINLIGNFDFTTSSSPVDIDALAAHYENEDFWRRSMQEGEDDSPESSVNAN